MPHFLQEASSSLLNIFSTHGYRNKHSWDYIAPYNKNGKGTSDKDDRKNIHEASQVCVNSMQKVETGSSSWESGLSNLKNNWLILYPHL